MENYVSAQLGQLGAAVALGAAGGLVYDLLRAARLIDRHDSWLTHLLDGLFAAALGAGALWLGLVVGGGELRLYMITGMALGAALWFCLPSRLLRPVWDFWIAALLALCRLLWVPFAFVGRWLKKLAALAKKGFSFLEKCAKIKVDAWKSHHTPEETPQKKGGRAMARTKKTKRAKKRPHTAMLLVIVALVAVLGVQIVRVYAEGGTADRGRSGSAADTAAAGKRRAALRSGQEG